MKCIYIDPPYNTNASEINYKNGYKHSSWMTLIDNRISISKYFLSQFGILSIAIDDIEFNKLKFILEQNFGDSNELGNIVVIQNPGGRHDDKFIATTHEYSLFFAKNSLKSKINLLPLEDSDIKSFNKSDNLGMYRTREFRRSGNNSTRNVRPKIYFPIFYKDKKIIIPTTDEMENIFKDNKFNDNYIVRLSEKYLQSGYKTILPIDPKGIHRVWRWGTDTIELRKNEDRKSVV